MRRLIAQSSKAKQQQAGTVTELSPTKRQCVQVRRGKRAHAVASNSDDEDELVVSDAAARSEEHCQDKLKKSACIESHNGVLERKIPLQNTQGLLSDDYIITERHRSLSSVPGQQPRFGHCPEAGEGGRVCSTRQDSNEDELGPPPSSFPLPVPADAGGAADSPATAPTTGTGAAAATGQEPAPPTTGASGGRIWGRGNKSQWLTLLLSRTCKRGSNQAACHDEPDQPRTGSNSQQDKFQDKKG